MTTCFNFLLCGFVPFSPELPDFYCCRGVFSLCSVDPADHKKTACYDIDVEVDDPLKSQMNNFLSSTTNQQEIAALEMKAMLSQSNTLYLIVALIFPLCLVSCSVLHQQIHETIEYINQLKTERDFMLSFSNNPQDFIQDWLKSQSRDLKVNVMRFQFILHRLHNNIYLKVPLPNIVLC